MYYSSHILGMHLRVVYTVTKSISTLIFQFFAVEIGQNRNEIANIKITNNLGSEYYFYLKGYLKRKPPLKIVT